MKRKNIRFMISFLICFSGHVLQGQMENLHGNFSEFRIGVHSGNMVRTTFYNDGMIGRVWQDPEAIGGEWPINNGSAYLAEADPMIGAEVIDINGQKRHIFSEAHGSSVSTSTTNEYVGDISPDGSLWYTFEPLPRFANPDTTKIAMSHWTWAWPTFWPDKMDDAIDPGWPGSWNGYFGKNVYSADQESYFVMDDYNNREWEFYPDSTDNNRRGLAMLVTSRGLQWSNALVEDCIYFIYDIKNIGTSSYNRVVFADMIDAPIGAQIKENGDFTDDNAAYDLNEDMCYNWDNDGYGVSGWYPVAYMGFCFLESPGNPFDGIDNDGDGIMGSGSVISETMFEPRTLSYGENIVLIDYFTYKRQLTTMSEDTVRINYHNESIDFWLGKVLVEIANNGIDDNLNGLIDENSGETIGDPPIIRYLHVGKKCINYTTGEGSDNPLIDERCDDKIDNDGDWNPITDDVGLDGLANSGDYGEGDGSPTSGAGTNLPGEPHTDKVDISESDMIGLTSFFLLPGPSTMPLNDDEKEWFYSQPGYLDSPAMNRNIRQFFSAGYFPMIPDQTERFSVGLLFGDNQEDLFVNKHWMTKAYEENYNFAKAPYTPTLSAVAGDNKVTLYWDDWAEQSNDPITGLDFEGYRIYRSTDPGFNDMIPITDNQGSVTYRKPLAQFDLANNFQGNSPIAVKGVQFWLGQNTGLVHSWVDSTAKNGYTYYYAVTSYDHGDPVLDIPPSECSRYIAVNSTGQIDKGKNVIIVHPEASAAGYMSSKLDTVSMLAGGSATGRIGYEIVDPRLIPDNHTYQITFTDTIITTADNFLSPTTQDFSLIDVTNSTDPEILIANSSQLAATDIQPLIHGFRLSLYNEKFVTLNTAKSGWSRENIYGYYFKPYKFSKTSGIARAHDYRIEFGAVGVDTSTSFLRGTKEVPAKPVNFFVTNLTSGRKIEFCLYELDGSNGEFSAFTEGARIDQIYFLEPDENNILQPSWDFRLLVNPGDSLLESPRAGDAIDLIVKKPFLVNDVYQFTTRAAKIDENLAKNQMDKIRVVPNPYVVTNSWEPANPFTSGRGPRQLHFTHLPQECTIMIFNLRGQLVTSFEHKADIWDGTEVWDMRTKDNLDIAYGVYIYHVNAGGIGEKIGKFAIIK